MQNTFWDASKLHTKYQVANELAVLLVYLIFIENIFILYVRSKSKSWFQHKIVAKAKIYFCFPQFYEKQPSVWCRRVTVYLIEFSFVHFYCFLECFFFLYKLIIESQMYLFSGMLHNNIEKRVVCDIIAVRYCIWFVFQIRIVCESCNYENIFQI